MQFLSYVVSASSALEVLSISLDVSLVAQCLLS